MFISILGHILKIPLTFVNSLRFWPCLTCHLLISEEKTAEAIQGLLNLVELSGFTLPSYAVKFVHINFMFNAN